jgi:hypothetical protein
LATNDTLLNTVWPEIAVNEAVLTVAIRELRQALGDQARCLQFIETVHGRSYRFMDTVGDDEMPAQEQVSDAKCHPPLWYPVVGALWADEHLILRKQLRASPLAMLKAALGKGDFGRLRGEDGKAILRRVGGQGLGLTSRATAGSMT